MAAGPSFRTAGGSDNRAKALGRCRPPDFGVVGVPSPTGRRPSVSWPARTEPAAVDRHRRRRWYEAPSPNRGALICRAADPGSRAGPRGAGRRGRRRPSGCGARRSFAPGSRETWPPGAARPCRPSPGRSAGGMRSRSRQGSDNASPISAWTAAPQAISPSTSPAARPQSARASRVCSPGAGRGAPDGAGGAREPRRRGRLDHPLPLHKGAPGRHMGMGPRLGEAQHRSEARVGSLEKLAPFVTGARKEEPPQPFRKFGPAPAVHALGQILALQTGQAQELRVELRFDGAERHPLAVGGLVAPVEGGAAVDEVRPARVPPPARCRKSLHEGHQRSGTVDDRRIDHLARCPRRPARTARQGCPPPHRASRRRNPPRD